MKIKIFFIDINKGTFGTDEIEDNNEVFYKMIGCRMIDITNVEVDHIIYDVICDDEGLYEEKGPMPSVVDRNGKVLLVGTLIFCHNDGNGNLTGLNDGEAKLLSKYMEKVRALRKKEEDNRPDEWYVMRLPFTV